MKFEQTADPLSGTKITYRIALLGAESSGKTTLATDLTAALCAMGYNAGMVPEYLRIWCEQNSRLPEFTDQEVILAGQIALEDSSADQCDILVCDPAAITTGFYSWEYFGSDLHLQRELLDRYDQLFLCDIDFPWQPDPLREGESAREDMQSLIVTYLTQTQDFMDGKIPLLSGPAPQRLSRALTFIRLPELLR